jgi:iron complex outermembrane recepter protein
MSGRHTQGAGLAWAAFMLLRCGAAFAADGGDLTSLSLEQLMNEPVTSVSKKQTRLSESPAAITVVTQDDLQRMGITTLPEALRLVPGMDVAQIDTNQWAVSARGFNSEFADKLLVLIDGRTVYTPASGGVFWNAQDVVLEDVERIEVIRGPGATLWGANAVNGVVNIITKSARDTQGALLAAAGGSLVNPLLTARYGGQVDSDLSWRVYAKYFDRDGIADQTRTADQGPWHSVHGGFRTDRNASAEDAITVQADTYDGQADNQVTQVTLAPPSALPIDNQTDIGGSDLLARWTRTLSTDSTLELQTYFDQVNQGDGYGREHRNTFDFYLQHRFGLGSRNDLIWGVDSRYTSIQQRQSANLTWSPLNLDIGLYSLFVQDEISLVPEKLRLILGSKAEHNELSGLSVEPDLRLLWTPSDRQTVWTAASRASRTPAEFELDGTLNLAAFQSSPNGPPVALAIVPSLRLQSEELLAYELGYRFQPLATVSIDLSSFFNRYDKVVNREPVAGEFVASPVPHVLAGLMEENVDDARTFGVEASVQWQPVREWKLMGSYSWLRMHVWPDPTEEYESPRGQFQARSYLDLPWRFELNTAVYYVDSVLEQSGPALVRIASYVRFDAGLIWKRDARLSIGLWGQNLFDGRHLEFASQNTTLLTPVPQSWLAKVTCSF